MAWPSEKYQPGQCRKLAFLYCLGSGCLWYLLFPISITVAFLGLEKQPMLVCAKQRGACIPTSAPDPPVCPKPPKKPISWFIPIFLLAFCSLIGLLYKYYLYKLSSMGEMTPPWRPRKRVKRPTHSADLPPCVQYLIIGTGAAGWAAYRSILDNDSKAKVFFITKEDCLPYIRPPMSKHMWWNPEPPDIKTLYYIENWKQRSMYYAQCKHFLDPVKFYRRKNGPVVGLASGWCVVRIDADDHVVYIEDNCGDVPIYYEKCLLAPGSYSKNMMIFKTAPKAVRDRVATLRTIRDLEIAYRKVQAAKHVTIIGGGLIGTELAYHIGRMHKEWFPPPSDEYVPPHIVHVYKNKGILSGILPEYLGEWAAEKVRCENVTMLPNVQVYDAFISRDGDDKLELTLSDGGCIKTDFVFVAVGAEARTDIAIPSYLETDSVNGGYLVNTELEARTDLYVAGDAASIYSQWKDTRIRMEHYGSAEEQGIIAGANMTGYWTPCNMEPHFWLRLKEDIQMEVVGEVGACMPTIGIFKPCDNDPLGRKYELKLGEFDKPCYKDTEEYRNRYKRGMLFYLRDEIVVGMMFWNFPPIEDRYQVCTEMLRARPTYKDINVLAELLGFEGLECVYIPDAEIKVAGPCIKNSKWMPYPEYDKIRELSNFGIYKGPISSPLSGEEGDANAKTD